MSVENKPLSPEEDRHMKYQQRYRDKSRELASACFQALENLPGAPGKLGYFTGVLKKVFTDNEVIRCRDGETFVGSFCATMPTEIIRAAGARPIKLCVNDFVGFHIGDFSMPRDACPLVKAAFGTAAGGIREICNACDLFIVPISCDGKKTLASRLAEIKPTLPLCLPLNRADDSGMDTYIKELKKIAARLSELTGTAVTRESLAREIRRQAEVQRDILTFSRLKREDGILIRGTHALTVLNALAYDDLSSWGSHLKELNQELLEKKSRNAFLTAKKLPRILLTGSPITFPNFKIPLMIEEQGGIIVADGTCLGDRSALDPVSVCDDSLDGYYRALANRCIKPCACPIFPDHEMRIRRLEKTVRDARVDGIVYHVLRGCTVYDYEFEQIERHFGAEGIPVIRLESDFSEEDAEQLRIRVDAFIEMITFRKKREEDTYHV